MILHMFAYIHKFNPLRFRLWAMKESGKQKSPEVFCMNALVRSFPEHYMLGHSEGGGEPEESLQGWSWVSEGKHEVPGAQGKWEGL